MRWLRRERERKRGERCFCVGVRRVIEVQVGKKGLRLSGRTSVVTSDWWTHGYNQSDVCRQHSELRSVDLDWNVMPYQKAKDKPDLYTYKTVLLHHRPMTSTLTYVQELGLESAIQVRNE